MKGKLIHSSNIIINRTQSKQNWKNGVIYFLDDATIHSHIDMVNTYYDNAELFHSASESRRDLPKTRRNQTFKPHIFGSFRDSIRI